MDVKSRSVLQNMRRERGGHRYSIFDRILGLLWKDIIQVSIHLGKTKHLFYIDTMLTREYLALKIKCALDFILLREELLRIIKKEYTDGDVYYCKDTALCTIDWT
jgi:hypothetical protein